MIYVITGERGAGKSTLCRRLAAEAGRGGLSVAGLVTERLGGQPDSPRRVTDLASGESRVFGSQHVAPGPPTPATPPSPLAPGVSDPLTPGWEYDGAVFAWANEVLSHSTPCDLLVVDELGPLELQGKRGWAGALEVLRSGDFHAALVVCRPALLPELAEQLGSEPGLVVEVDAETRDGLVVTILERLLPA